MTWLSNLSIKRKLIVLIFGITLLAQIIAFSILSLERFNYLKKELINQSNIQAKLIGEYCVSPLIFDDMDGLNQILQKIESLPFILSAAIYDPKGELVTSHQNTVELAPVPLHEMHEDIYTKNILHVRESINHEGINYGHIHLRVSTTQLRTAISHQIVIFLLIVLGTIFFIYWLANRFQGLISTPIMKLAAFTDEISQTGDYTLQIEKQSVDETGKLYDNFNNMIRQIKVRQEERDKADKALHKSQKLLNETQRLAEVGGWEYYLQTQQLTWTDEVYKIYGVTKKEYNPSNLERVIQFYAPEDQIVISEAFHNVIEKGEPYDLELQLINNQGEKIWVRTIGQAEFRENKIIRVFGNIMDITKRKLAEQELKKYHDHLEDLVKERTRELEEKNKKLEEFNDLFVNREFRIKELKDKLKELEVRD